MQLLFCQEKAFDLAFITFTAYTNKDAIVLFFFWRLLILRYLTICSISFLPYIPLTIKKNRIK